MRFISKQELPSGGFPPHGEHVWQSAGVRHVVERKCVDLLLPRLAESLRLCADTHNQVASDRVRVEGPHDGAGGAYIEMIHGKAGFRFQEIGCGCIQVLDIGRHPHLNYARLHPVVDCAGVLVAWEEKRLDVPGTLNRRTLAELSDVYLLLAVRDLLLRATVTPGGVNSLVCKLELGRSKSHRSDSNR